MKIFGLAKLSIGSSLTSLGGLLLLLLTSISTGCGDDGTMDMTQPDITPQTLFDMNVKPELLSSCSCHQAAQSGGMIQPFVVPGMEYQAVTTYKSGLFLSTTPVMSLLLLKGQHTGPAFTTDQY